MSAWEKKLLQSPVVQQLMIRIWHGNFTLLSFLKKYSHFWAFLTRVEMWDDHGTWTCSPAPPQLHWCRQECVFASFFIKPMICSLVLLMLSSRLFSQHHSALLWVYSVNRWGLSTQPWGAPVFSTWVEEVWPPVQTVWGLSVRKSSTQSVVLKPRVLSMVSFMGRLCWMLSWNQQTHLN